MQKVSFNLPDTITVLAGRESGDKVVVETKRLAAHAEALFPAMMTAAIKVILTNAYNGPGAKAHQSEKKIAMDKKLASWYRGEFNVVNRGDSATTALREAYIDDVRSKTNASARDVEASIKATVTAAFGSNESASFGRFMDAMALLLAREAHGKDATPEQIGESREAFEAHYQALADEAAKRRGDAAAKIDLTAISLASFAKLKV